VVFRGAAGLSWLTVIDWSRDHVVAAEREEWMLQVLNTKKWAQACLIALGAIAIGDVALAREYLPLPPDLAGRTYSPGVVTKGGKMVWLAGVTTLKDEQGKSLAGDVEGQTRFIFREIERNLAKVGGKLDDIVSMTVYLTDARSGTDFTKVRREVFPKNALPASSQVTVATLALPGALVEVACVAVVGDEK
jgi:2-iminobutanoate/2-iminopropanoate deaminase